MSHPLVRTTEAFLAKHLGLNLLGHAPGNAAGAAGAGRKGDKGGKGAGKKDKGGTEKGVEGLSLSDVHDATSDAAGTGTATEGSKPYVTLLISLSGGK